MIQWRLTITCITFFLYIVDWRFHFVDWASYRRIIIKEEMGAVLFKQHLQHFSKATRTPFTVDPLLLAFGEFAEKEAMEQF
eukprot:1358441-Ditylum_brightwellii.AAC.1